MQGHRKPHLPNCARIIRGSTGVAGESEYHHKDLLNATTLITDDNQQPVASYAYNVFGDLRWSYEPSGTDNPHKFTGKEFDASVRLLVFLSIDSDTVRRYTWLSR